MAIWQTKEFDEAPMMIEGRLCGFFSGTFFVDSDGEIVEITVDVQCGSGPLQLSEPGFVPNPFFRALRSGLEVTYRTELYLLREEIERASEARHQMEPA